MPARAVLPDSATGEGSASGTSRAVSGLHSLLAVPGHLGLRRGSEEGSASQMKATALRSLMREATSITCCSCWFDPPLGQPTLKG